MLFPEVISLQLTKINEKKKIKMLFPAELLGL